MFDTINFWVDRQLIRGDPFTIIQHLDNVTERQNENTGYSCSGCLGNYKVSCFQSGISIKGSLAKYFLPSNVYSLTRQTTQEAIEQMSDNLHIDLLTAKVTRLDIAKTLPTKRPPKDYYNHLGQKPHFARVQGTKNTLYYQTDKRQLCFYDKTKEATKNKAEIPQTLIGCNLLRYELRFTKELQRQLLQRDPITGKLLFDKEFYFNAVQLWKNEFEAIKKINTIESMIDNVKTPKEAETALFAKMLQQGGQSIIDDYISDLKAKQAFADPKYYSRLKSDLNKIMQAPNEAKSDLMQELEIAIADIAKYAR